MLLTAHSISTLHYKANPKKRKRQSRRAARGTCAGRLVCRGWWGFLRHPYLVWGWRPWSRVAIWGRRVFLCDYRGCGTYGDATGLGAGHITIRQPLKRAADAGGRSLSRRF